MKKFLAGIMALTLGAAAVCGFAACKDGNGANSGNSGNSGNPNSNSGNSGNNGGNASVSDLEVYAPDGAPALALCYAIAEEEKKEDDRFDFEIVDANKIATFVTGANPAADICVMPVNAAAKTLGTGATYQMLGTVTNGNLYFLTTGTNPELTKDNLSTLVGKKVGVIQLQNVPGLTLQVVLNEYNVPYEIVQSAEAAKADKVNLIPFAPDDVTPAGGCDYYLCPEPAMSAKIKGTADKPLPFKAAGDLQKLYGEEGGYPQAAVVVKKSVLESRKQDVETFLGYLEKSATYLETADVATILHLLEEEREDGLTPSFSDKNLTSDVIKNCSVRFTASKDCKEKVVAFLEKLIAVSAESTKKPDDAFFYMG